MLDYVVIGSGFGGAVVASRLAAAGRSVCVLERGRRWTAPEFPRSVGEVADAFWDDESGRGFLEYLAFRRFDVIQGAGVGGGSLHYFNVNLPAPAPVFDNPAWPGCFRDDGLQPFYDVARETLESAPLVPPAGRVLPERTSEFMNAARRGGFEPELVPIAVYTGQERQLDGVGREAPCTYCGNCLFGCNDGAKRTLDRNYLALAERDGADVRPLHLVDSVTPVADGGYDVRYRVLASDPAGHPEPGVMRARHVVVAAGSLGSTALLLRCRDEFKTLPRLSPALGTRFSLNGEFLFAYADRVPAEVSAGHGPPITAQVTARSGDLVATVQDLGIPDSLLWFLEGAVPPPFARLRQLRDALVEYARRTSGRRHAPSNVRLGALMSHSRTTHVLPYLGMGTDSSDGTIRLRRGEIDVSWNARANRDLYRLIDQTARTLSESAGGRHRTSFLSRWPLRKILTAHPLGGCPMGADGHSGVVDDRGRVHGYDGLFVVDGATIPTALAVNPSLTIAALAERSAAAMLHPTTPPELLAPATL